MTEHRAMITWLVVSCICQFSALDRTRANDTMPNVPPTVEEILRDSKELKAESDLVAHLRVESVERLMSYGGLCIEIRSSWYLAHCSVLKTLHGATPDDAETIDVLFWTKTDATVLGFHLPADRRERDGFSNSVKLVRRPVDKGRNERFELVAFLRDTQAEHPLKRMDAPPFFAPTLGFGTPEEELISLGRHKVVRID